MNPSQLFKFLIIVLVFTTSCKSKQSKTSAPSESITLEKLSDSPSYSEAALVLRKAKSVKSENGKTMAFDFDVQNYTLGAQTESPNASQLANSAKGQHIHFILNNQPYSAHYAPTFEKNIPNGEHHLVAFLSRSYHESVKNKNSVVVKKLVVGNQPEEKTEERTEKRTGLNMTAPTLIYSRPKGTYKGQDTERILLDFFVLNTTLSTEGNKVKVTINDTEFLVTEWSPYVIKGLPKGEVTIQLELVDAKGQNIAGPFNSAKRSITLEE